MMADLDTPLLQQVIGYLCGEAEDLRLPEWRRDRASVLAARLNKLEDALSQTDREK